MWKCDENINSKASNKKREAHLLFINTHNNPVNYTRNHKTNY